MMCLGVKKPDRKNPGGWRGEEGFTLAELMVLVGIMVLFLVGVGSMLSSGAKSSTTSYNVVRIQEAANEALDTMTRQIRVAEAVDAMSNESYLRFQGDLDGSGVPRYMAFAASGGYLMRGSSADDMQQWIEGVESVTFTYYQYNETTKQLEVLNPGDPGWNVLVHRVDIELNMSRAGAGVVVNRTFTASVTLRNDL